MIRDLQHTRGAGHHPHGAGATTTGMNRVGRRGVLRGLAMAAAALGLPGFGWTTGPDALRLGPAAPFSFESLVEDARRASRRPFRPVAVPSPEILDRIDYDAHWRLRFRKAAAPVLGGSAMPVQFFHLGRYAREPVSLHLVEAGLAREIRYDSAMFDMPADSPARNLGSDAGFAGFRAMRRDHGPDWLSFLGASYFRCDGPEGQYGLSARGLAIDTGLDRPEEFPAFSALWLAPPESDAEDIVVYARLEGPSVSGAYRIAAKHREGAGQRCRITARLFFRNSVERLGVAPLTSMFWYSKSNRTEAVDWRPQVHDSDGLALATGTGERIWRPLGNPGRVVTSSFVDRNPRGFGLIQRDRSFGNYQDDGVFYDRRPSAWVTPAGDWGAGAVQLVEIPTEDETFDNIVAYWTPQSPPPVGREVTYEYQLDWVARDPMPSLARVTATRTGQGGIPGQPVPPGVIKYAIDFEGASLAGLDSDDGVVAAIDARNGKVIRPSARRIVGTDRWRLIFDLDGAAGQPVDLRAYLRRGDQPLSETWVALAELPGAEAP